MLKQDPHLYQDHSHLIMFTADYYYFNWGCLVEFSFQFLVEKLIIRTWEKFSKPSALTKIINPLWKTQKADRISGLVKTLRYGKMLGIQSKDWTVSGLIPCTDLSHLSWKKPSKRSKSQPKKASNATNKKVFLPSLIHTKILQNKDITIKLKKILIFIYIICDIYYISNQNQILSNNSF